MNRSDMLLLSDVKQRGSFNAFTPEQRYNVWIDKLIQVRNMGINSEEQIHIDLLIAKIKISWFDEQTKKDPVRTSEIDRFLRKWVDDAYNLSGWDRDAIGRMIATLYDVEGKDNTIVVKSNLVAIDDEMSPKSATIWYYSRQTT